MHETDHSAHVDAWMKAVAFGDAPTEQLIHVFEDAFGAMWQRANLTLGDVTLGAIAERVIYTAVERFPVLTGCEVDTSGVRCRALLERAGGLPREQVKEGLRFVLVEFITVLGNLTAEILSPALHTELSNAAFAASRLAGESSGGQAPSAARVEDQGAKS